MEPRGRTGIGRGVIHAASVGASSAPARAGGRIGIGLVAGQVCATGAAVWLARSTTEASLPVVLPLTVAAIAAGVFYLALRQWRRSDAPFFEVGGVYVAVVTLYAVYPLVGFLVLGLGYSSSNDDRLAVGRPGPEEVGLIGWYYVLHLVVFGGAYLLARGRGAGPGRPRSVEAPTLTAALALYAALTAYFGFLALFYDLSARTYAESYLVSSRLPLPLAQLTNHLGGARFVVELVILAALFTNYRRWRWLIAAWLAVVTVVAFARLGSRAEMVLLWLAAAVMYDLMVRRLRVRRVAIPAAAGLLVFLGIGLARDGWFSAPGQRQVLFAYATEFETIFANALHLNRLVASGEVPALPAGAIWSDLLALIPQQLSPIPKLNPADWYVQTYFPGYAASGGGLAFGTIAESLVGEGATGVVWRSALLGAVLGCFHAWVSSVPGRLWPMLLYVWVTVSLYQSFRSTTFVLLGFVFYRFLPVALAVGLLSHVLKGIAPRVPSPRGVAPDAAT